MHACLRVAEIVLNIAEMANELLTKSDSDSDSDSGEDDEEKQYARLKRDPALSLALCCKSLHVQVIGVIWRKLTSFSPLFHCFSSDIWSAEARDEAVDNDDPLMSGFLRPPNKNEWGRFLFHSSKVRTLEIDCSDDDFCPGDLRCLSVYRPTFDLFPSLCHLTWQNGRREEVMFSHMLISPRLATATVEQDCSESTSMFLQSLVDNAPAIRHLEVKLISADPEGLCRYLEEIISNFIYLTHFAAIGFDLSPTALEQLSVLPHLRELNCQISSPLSYDVPPARWQNNNNTPFPALQLFQPTFKNITLPVLNLFEDLIPSAMDSLKITLTVQPKSSVLHSLLQVIAKYPLLRSLQITLSRKSTHHQPEYLVDESVLRPLFSSKIISIDMGSIPFRLDDQSLKTIGSALPSLCSLNLGNTVEVVSSTVTYTGLVAVTTHCPQLRTLGIHLDLNSILVDDLKLPKPQSCLALRYLEVAPIVIGDPSSVAAALSALLPNAKVACRANIASSAKIQASLHEVNRLKGIFTLVRNQERRAKHRKSLHRAQPKNNSPKQKDCECAPPTPVTTIDVA